MISRHKLIPLFISFLSISGFAKNHNDALLLELDLTLSQQIHYDSTKIKRINEIKNELSSVRNTDKKHWLYLDLYKEYEAFIYDSAVYYAKEHYQMSIQDKDPYWINECKMQRARMLSTFTRFQDAIDLLNTIPQHELNDKQLGSYYERMAEVYIYWGEHSNADEMAHFSELRNHYQDSALMALPHGSYDYHLNYGRKCIDHHQFDEARSALLPYLDSLDVNTRDYAILTSLISYLYEMEGNEELYVEYMIRSAIADARAAVKENTSISSLAFYLLNKGDVERANRYIKKSLEDANYYNGRLRTVQISRVLPAIDRAWQMENDEHDRKMKIAITFIFILFLLSVVLVFYLVSQMRKLTRIRKELTQANRDLQKTNVYLAETNHIKEEYIGLFLNQCSIYIDKLENYRKALNKKAAAGKMNDLFDMLKSSQIIEDELKEFYNTFDHAFLNIFPDFVEKFNQLLPEEERITPKNESNLTIELRIFALLRLGITDSAKIASFLRYSITTIYNYRSKYRNKSLVGREAFEEKVMKLSSADSKK